MPDTFVNARVDTVVVGGGQTGLSVGYHLSRLGVPFVILDGSRRIGDSWRHRWDSLRLFTPARYAGLDGMPFPAEPFSFPTKDAMADYLESYARRFDLPVRSGVRVDRLSRLGDRFIVVAGNQRIEARNVVVAMGNTSARVVRHSRESCDPRSCSSIRSIPQPVATPPRGCAGCRRRKLRSGNCHGNGHASSNVARRTGDRPVPFRVDGLAARLGLSRLVLRVIFHRVLSMATPIGRRLRPKMLHRAAPLIRTKPRHLAAAGVQRIPKVVGVRNGLPLLEDGRVLDVANIVWCTGFDAAFSWIDLPAFGADGMPEHDAGVVESEPGLFFVGLPFLYAFSSEMIHGVGRDAARIAGAIAERTATATKTARPPLAATA